MKRYSIRHCVFALIFLSRQSTAFIGPFPPGGPSSSSSSSSGGGLTTAILSINADTTAAQTMSVGTSGTDFAISDGGSGAHTFNLPSASATVRGVVTTSAQTLGSGIKSFPTAVNVGTMPSLQNQESGMFRDGLSIVNDTLGQTATISFFGGNPGGPAFAGHTNSLGQASLANAAGLLSFGGNGVVAYTSPNPGVGVARVWTARIAAKTNGDIMMGPGGDGSGSSALATNATGGFFTMDSCAGLPTGTPANLPTGYVPTVINTTNNGFYGYYGSAWHILNGTTAVTLSDAATVALDASLGSVFNLTAAGNRTILVPTNPTDGQKIIINHTASGGARTLTLTTGSAGSFIFGTDITTIAATASGKTDVIGCIYDLGTNKWRVVAVTAGF